MGVTGKKVERSGIGGGARTTAGACSTDLHYGSRSLPAAYHHPESLGVHERCPGGPRVTINDSLVAAREETSHSERRIGTNMEDIVALCEGACRKRCHLRVAAKELDGEATSCSSGSKPWPYRFAKIVQEEWAIGNGNDAEPRPPDVQCSVGL